MFDEHEVIIAQGNCRYQSNFTDTSKIDVVNVYAPPICEASENGVDSAQSKRDHINAMRREARARRPEHFREKSRESYARNRTRALEDKKRYYLEHREQKIEYSRQYKLDHHEEILQKDRERPARPPSKEVQKRYYERHREQRRAKWRVYYHKNKEYMHVRYASWQSANSDRHNARIAKRKTLKTQAGGSYTAAEWQALKSRYNYTCLCCGKAEPEIKLTVDHIIPVTKHGSSNIENIQPLCHSCNASKGANVVDYRPEKCLPMCEASERGIPCWHHAEIVYHTTPYKMNGVFYPSETRHLCKACYEKMWGFISAWHEARARHRLQDCTYPRCGHDSPNQCGPQVEQELSA